MKSTGAGGRGSPIRPNHRGSVSESMTLLSASPPVEGSNRPQSRRGCPFLVNRTRASNPKAAERKVVTWQVSGQPSDAEGGAVAIVNRATWEQFCAVNPSRGEGEPAEIAEPPAQPSKGSAAWEYDGTLQWELRPARQRWYRLSSACRWTLMHREHNPRTGSWWWWNRRPRTTWRRGQS